MARLKRALGLAEATLYGVGIIVGAGIYALIGKVCGLAGNAVWLSFAISSLLAIFTGLSYAELASMFPKDSAEYDYARFSLGSRFLGLLVAWFVIGASIISASTVAVGFGNYLSALLFGQSWNWSINLAFIQLNLPTILAILAIAVFTLINYMGIELSDEINIPSTLMEVGGLILIILGAAWLLGSGQVHPANYLEMPNGWNGILAGSVLAFFAYIGFGSIAKMGEEMKDPKKNLPRAILLSIVITTVLYILVALASVTLVDWRVLYNSPNPATIVTTRVNPILGYLISLIALVSTGNTILLILISGSRMMYGVATSGAMPKPLASVNRKTRTPHIAVFTVGALAVIFTLIKDIQTIAEVTNIWIFIIYIFVNLAVILLRYKEPKKKRAFKMPLNIGRFPIPALLGLLASMALLAYSLIRTSLNLFHPGIWLTYLLVVGALVFHMSRESRSNKNN